ncbi:MAG: imidazolonepropionase [Lachnospiraceae bacterium]|nr:imidazolonepropionase [Lachnospiraceae bacterium]
MARGYRHIQEHEKEILELKAQGATHREIAEHFGFTKEQVKGFFKRVHKKERKLAAGIPVRKKGRPVTRTLNPATDKLSELRYVVARQEAKIKALEMENELMRDFLSLTERK